MGIAQQFTDLQRLSSINSTNNKYVGKKYEKYDILLIRTIIQKASNQRPK